MNRRSFLTFLGLGSAGLLIDPKFVLPKTNTLEVFKDYPKLAFTGFKASQTSCMFAGQFLWAVCYEDLEGKKDRVYWYCQVQLALFDMNRHKKNLEAYVRTQLQLGNLTVLQMLEDTIQLANEGKVKLAKCHQIPNPNFNPDLPETTGYEGDEEEVVYNPKTINGPNIILPIRKMWFEPYAGEMEFDVDQQTALVVQRLKA